MLFDIQPSSPTPIYRQIVEQVHRLIASGQLRPNEALPSVRTVALLHTINPMTVSKAYSLLEADGSLIRQRGTGMVVAAAPSAGIDKIAMLTPTLVAAARIAQQLQIDHAIAHAVFESCLTKRTEHEHHEPE